MRKELLIGLVGLILSGVVGCEMNRPYRGPYALGRNHYGPAETAYRPRTVVTMRAEEVPENPAAISACPTVQVINPSGTVIQTAAQEAGSVPMVTLVIPAMKITVPMTATVAAPSAFKETSSPVSHVPSTSGGVVQAVDASPTLTSSSAAKSTEADLHPAAPVQKEEKSSSHSTTSETPSAPAPESKSKTKSSASGGDSPRLPKLSLLPPEPPPEFTIHRASGSVRTKEMDLPPPPPPIPKAASSNGPALPSEDSESK